MTVRIKLGGPLRERVSGHIDGEMDLDLPEGSRVSDALAALGLSLDQVRVMMLGGRPVTDDVELRQGDRLALFPPELAFNMYVAINFYNRLLGSGR